MPHLEDVTYSRDACVAAVRGFYQFLVDMYLDESDIIKPPDGGWLRVTAQTMQGLNKTDEVMALLRYLPYIGDYFANGHHIQGTPWCEFADWQYELRYPSGNEELKLMTEKDSHEDVPPHVFGLTLGGRGNPVFPLNTQLSFVYWADCPDEIYNDSTRVIDVYATVQDADGMVPLLQNIYRQHGWPELERYRKRDCLVATQNELREKYTLHPA